MTSKKKKTAQIILNCPKFRHFETKRGGQYPPGPGPLTSYTTERRGDKTQPCRSPTPPWNGFNCLPFTRPQTSGRQENELMTHNNWPSTPYSSKTFQSLSRRSRSYAFSRSTKHAKNLCHTSKISRRFTSEWRFIWSVVLRPGRKPHWPSSSFYSTISRHRWAS